jgi:hypothetical protein
MQYYNKSKTGCFMKTYMVILLLFAGLAAAISSSGDVIKERTGMSLTDQRIQTALAQSMGGHQTGSLSLREFLAEISKDIPWHCKEGSGYLKGIAQRAGDDVDRPLSRKESTRIRTDLAKMCTKN